MVERILHPQCIISGQKSIYIFLHGSPCVLTKACFIFVLSFSVSLFSKMWFLVEKKHHLNHSRGFSLLALLALPHKPHNQSFPQRTGGLKPERSPNPLGRRFESSLHGETEAVHLIPDLDVHKGILESEEKGIKMEQLLYLFFRCLQNPKTIFTGGLSQILLSCINKPTLLILALEINRHATNSPSERVKLIPIHLNVLHSPCPPINLPSWAVSWEGKADSWVPCFGGFLKYFCEPEKAEILWHGSSRFAFPNCQLDIESSAICGPTWVSLSTIISEVDFSWN